ncbi:MAG: efflux RND transporter periplasmic adaptor subunit, partial [Deferribacterota bacterium]|nr:efflux RND transporter periplasmic adaptor subunit [Deferribacterota bacterium]
YADAKFSYSLGEKISVSEEALFRTGTRQYVFLKSGDNHIKPVIVKTGVLGGDGYYEVLSGLDTGDMVVSPANFLIDSESRLKAVFRMVTDGHNH